MTTGRVYSDFVQASGTGALDAIRMTAPSTGAARLITVALSSDAVTTDQVVGVRLRRPTSTGAGGTTLTQDSPNHVGHANGGVTLVGLSGISSGGEVIWQDEWHIGLGSVIYTTLTWGEEIWIRPGEDLAIQLPTGFLGGVVAACNVVYAEYD